MWGRGEESHSRSVLGRTLQLMQKLFTVEEASKRTQLLSTSRRAEANFS